MAHIPLGAAAPGAGVRLSITPFTFGAHAVRVLMRDGAPWFVAADVCVALGYRNTSDAVAAHLDEDERYSQTLDRGGSLVFINESGLYALVLRSRKPQARRFAKWVTGEVLPSIRKTGGYSAPAQPAPGAQALAAAGAASAVAQKMFAEVLAALLADGGWAHKRWVLAFAHDAQAGAVPYVREDPPQTPQQLIEAWFGPNGHPFDAAFLAALAGQCITRLQQCCQARQGAGVGKQAHPFAEKGSI